MAWPQGSSPGGIPSAKPPDSGITGKISWFGGPGDSSAGATTASGAPVSQPGIAVYNRATLGGWWIVQTPNGKQAIVQQTDIGPAPWTGRAIDFTYSLLGHLGYTTSNFPTDKTATAVYLGNTIPSDLKFAGVPIIGKDTTGTAAQATGTKPVGWTQGVANAVTAPLKGLEAIGAFFSALGNPQTWLTILKFVAGAAALYLGLRGLMGDSAPSITREALKVARA